MKDNSDKIITKKILQVISGLRGKKVLEIGCGNGRITSLLVNKFKQLTAIEPDQDKIKEARENISGATFQVGSGEHLAFSDACFDLVIFTLSLHHQDSETAIAEAVRVLTEDGNLLIIEPTIEGEIQRAFSLVNSENRELINAQNAIRNCGLKIQYSEIFNAIWSFKSKYDLCQSIFDYYNEPFDDQIALEIIGLIGIKAEDECIELSDELVLHVLKKDL